jgi:coenzyme F420-dependent glucose-6-phosphate dehydrogenase
MAGVSKDNSRKRETPTSMATIGYHASHEQFAPSDLIKYVRRAEEAGFAAGMCSDHFHPWTERQGQSGYAWSWLGAALQATSATFGVVTAPGQRYHPAIIAQAAATLAEMFPGRFWVAAGSGQALNEHITGGSWPLKAQRNARLLESVSVMRALWTGETVTHHGLVTVEDAKLYTLPAESPPIFGAAITPQTAAWLGGWADGLITIAQPREEMKKLIDAFRQGGGEGKPMFLQVQLSYAEDEGSAWEGALDQWGVNVLGSPVLATLTMPEQFEEIGRYVRREDIEGDIRVSSDLEQHIAWLHDDVELGFDHLYLHNVNRDQECFLEAFGERVLPTLKHS